MTKFAIEQWEKNKSRLEEALKYDTELNDCSYKHLVKLVVEYIFNDSDEDCNWREWDSEKITQIDDGDYQGTLLFLIPQKTYQPCEVEYLMTYSGYGSCSGCDTLQSIQCWHYEKTYPTDGQLRDFMSLCKDLVCNTIKPYNKGWGYDPDFEEVQYE